MKSIIALLVFGTPVGAQCLTNTLWPSERNASDFGQDIAMYDDLLIVGHRQSNERGDLFFYRPDGRNWLEVDKIPGGPGFGCSVEIWEEYVATDAGDVITIFQWSGPNDWTSFDVSKPATAYPEDFLIKDGWIISWSIVGLSVTYFDRLDDGFVVPVQEFEGLNTVAADLDGEWLFIGGFSTSIIYRNQGGAWVQTQTLAHKGNEVTIKGSCAVVIGGERTNIYELEGEEWVRIQRFENFLSGGKPAFTSATSFVLSGDEEVVAFEKLDDLWIEAWRLQSPFKDDDTGFGVGMVSSGDSLVLAARRLGSTSTSQGGIATYDLSGELCASLSSSPERVSLRDGVDLVLELEAGSEFASELYVLAGSLTGSSPGVFLTPDLRIPLNLLDNAYSPSSLRLGLLDSEGRAMEIVTIPPNSTPQLAGLSLHHAFVVLTDQGLEHISNVAMSGLVNVKLANKGLQKVALDSLAGLSEAEAAR